MDTGVYTETLKPTVAKGSHFSSDEGVELYECWIATIRNCERRGSEYTTLDATFTPWRRRSDRSQVHY